MCRGGWSDQSSDTMANMDKRGLAILARVDRSFKQNTNTKHLNYNAVNINDFHNRKYYTNTTCLIQLESTSTLQVCIVWNK